MDCKLCQHQPAQPNGICNDCMDKVGIIEMPPARRPARPCMKCNGMKFVRVIPREYTIKNWGEQNVAEIAPMSSRRSSTRCSARA